ncbi:MAG: hypothetical protein N2578_07910, partial [Bdellovibrionaceae bacterium]|nr:hypothetical protein [Pseudobdellovibrionaceae bacterium]
VDPDDPKGLLFAWRGLPSDWAVSVHVGPSRKSLREYAKTTNPGETRIQTQLPVGKHFWKLVAIDPNSGQVMAESPIYKCEVLARYAPTVVFPLAEAEIPVEKSPFDLTFKWEKGADVRQVILEVARDKGLKEMITQKSFTTEDQFTLTQLNPGEYFWRMSSVYENSDKPLVGKVQRFRIAEISKLQAREPVQLVWTIPENQDTQSFWDNPRLSLSWTTKSGGNDVSQYRVLIEEEGGDPSAMRTLSTAKTEISAEVPKPGRFVASIEALDKDGQVIGKSQPRYISTVELPTLPAPQIIPAEGPIHAGADGKTELQWQKLEGATAYWVTILRDGKELEKRKYTGTSTSMKNLMPGSYQVKLAAIDEYGRAGVESEPRTLVVPDKSSLRAPRLKKMKIGE